MVNGVTALGGAVEQQGNTLVVRPPGLRIADWGPAAAFHAHACAVALHMLVPVFWTRGQSARVMVDESLASRSLEVLRSLAEQAGATISGHAAEEDEPAWVEVSGKLNAGSYRVEGSLPGQIASGMLIALAHATDEAGKPAPSRLAVTAPMASRPHLNLTLRMLKEFGYNVREEPEGVFAVEPAGFHSGPAEPHPQLRLNPAEVHMEGDWSLGAALLCANAMGSAVVIQNLRESASPQRGARMLLLLREMGMLVYENRQELYVTCPSRARLLPLAADCEDIPELAPMLALTCTQAHGRSVLSGLGRLREKEGGRLQATVELLRKMGGKASLREDGDALVIEGPTPLKGGFTADAGGDRQVVQLLAVAALVADGPVTVTGVEALSKAWPGFLETYGALGGRAEERP